jgi:hypothetical protein
LLKTFLLWGDEQLPERAVFGRSPSHTYVTAPAQRAAILHLLHPTGYLTAPDPARAQKCPDRTAMMPARQHTRAENHAHYIAAERRKNHNERQARIAAAQQPDAHARAGPDDDPPPF